MSTHTVANLYLQVKSHFFSKRWDRTVEHLPAVRVPKSLLENVAMVSQFKRLYRTYSTEEIKQYFIANAIGGDATCGIFRGSDGDDIFRRWQMRLSVVSDLVRTDLMYLRDHYVVKEWMVGYPPPVITLYLSKKLSSETLSFLVDSERFKGVQQQQIDPVYGDIIQRHQRYRMFVPISDEQFETMIDAVLAV
jgi:hypothetical protein